MSSRGNFYSAVKELKEKAKRALYANNSSAQIQILIKTGLKIFESATASNGGEVWSPSLQHDWATDCDWKPARRVLQKYPSGSMKNPELCV